MARLVNKETGSVVSVDDETAARLGPGWEAEKSAPKKAAAKQPAKK